jgi:hypothetical protein
MNFEKVFPIFFVTWIALGIGSALFYAKAGLETKRRWHPRLVIGTGALFFAFALTMQPNLATLLFAAPAVALIIILNWKLTKFCPKCGRTAYARLSPNRFCQRCGAALDTRS